jgi:hypothetical protein
MTRLTAIALCVAAGMSGAAFGYGLKINQQMTYQLVAENEAGESDVIDFDLSATDCAALQAYEQHAIPQLRFACETIR